MNATAKEREIKVLEARKSLSAQLIEYNATHLPRAQLKCWTRGKERIPIADEIIVVDDNNHTHVEFGIEYDDLGNVAGVYKTDINGRRINLSISNTTDSREQANLIAERVDEIKRREQSKVKVSIPTATKAVKKVTKRPSKIVSSRNERLV